MATKITSDQIQNLQQIEATVTGPDIANRLLTINGQFDISLNATGVANNFAQNTGIFTALVGPVLTRQQFFKAIGTASLAKTQINTNNNTAQTICNFSINNIDADWDDESGQVQLSVEVLVIALGENVTTSANGIAFQVMILYSA